MTDSTLEKFIAKVLELQNSQQATNLKNKGMYSVAQELGLSETEWLHIQNIAKTHVAQAEGFMAYQNWDDAITQLSQAVLLMPYELNVLYPLAFCHYQKWLSTKETVNSEAAISYAQQCLSIQATHNEAIKIISAIRQAKAQKKKTIQILLWVVLGIVILALAQITLYFFKDKKQTDNLNPNPIEIKTTTEQDGQKPDVPVIFKENDKSKGLSFVPVTSIFNEYNETYSYELKAYFAVKNYEFEIVEIRIDLIGKDNEVVVSRVTKVLDSYFPAMRSGDEIPFNILIYEAQKKPEIKKIELSVTNSLKTPSTVVYEPSKKIKHNWVVEKPANYDIEIYERYRQITTEFGGSIYQKIELEVKNIGNKEISSLTARIDWLDKGGKTLGSTDYYFSSTQLPRLARGKTRVSGGTYQVKNCKREDYGGYTVNIIQIE